MEKMDSIQSCLNSRLLEANPSRFTYGRASSVWASSPAWRHGVCARSAYGNPKPCPIGVSTWRPPKSRDKPSRSQQTIARSCLGSVCKAFTKPPVVTQFWQPMGTSRLHPWAVLIPRQAAHQPRWPESKVKSQHRKCFQAASNGIVRWWLR